MDTVQELPFWDEEFPEFFSMAIYGATTVGKTHLLKYLIITKLLKSYDKFVIMSPSLDTLEELREIVPGKFFFDKVESDILTGLLKMNQEYGKRVLVVIDDNGSDAKFMKALDALFFRGRHSFISTIFLAQDPKMLSVQCRGNSTYYIVMKQWGASQLEYTRKELVGGAMDTEQYWPCVAERPLPNKEFQSRVLRKYVNQKGDCLVFRPTCFEEEKRVSYFRAPAKLPRIRVRNYEEERAAVVKEDEFDEQLEEIEDVTGVEPVVPLEPPAPNYVPFAPQPVEEAPIVDPIRP